MPLQIYLFGNNIISKRIRINSNYSIKRGLTLAKECILVLANYKREIKSLFNERENYYGNRLNNEPL
jgi:hypothetical protein